VATQPRRDSDVTVRIRKDSGERNGESSQLQKLRVGFAVGARVAACAWACVCGGPARVWCGVVCGWAPAWRGACASITFVGLEVNSTPNSIYIFQAKMRGLKSSETSSYTTLRRSYTHMKVRTPVWWATRSGRVPQLRSGRRKLPQWPHLDDEMPL